VQHSGDIQAHVVQHSMALLQAQPGVLLELNPAAGELVARVSRATIGPPPARPGLRRGHHRPGAANGPGADRGRLSALAGARR